MKIWDISCDIDNDELSLKNEKYREILEEKLRGEPMADLLPHITAVISGRN